MEAELAVLWQTLDAQEPLPEKDRQLLVPYLKVRHLAAGEDFVKAGQTTRLVGFLANGILRYFYSTGGDEFTRYFCQGRSFVSSQTALVTGGPSLYTIRAVVETTLLTFVYADWLALAARSPAWSRIHRHILENALVLAEKRERSLVLDDAATRYQKFLAEYPGLEPHLKQYDVASYLGVTPVTLSRLRSRPAN